MFLDCPGGPNVITSVYKREIGEPVSEKGGEREGGKKGAGGGAGRDLKMLYYCRLWRWRGAMSRGMQAPSRGWTGK